MTRKTVAIMQPYFYPYLGYFRLFAKADEFVLLDCVQINRRGRVHRCELPIGKDHFTWLTLPLRKVPVGTRICDLQFSDSAAETWPRRLNKHDWLARPPSQMAQRVYEHLSSLGTSPVDYLEAGLSTVMSALNLTTPILRSSTFGITPELRGQDRIIEIALRRGADRYINLPGGRSLYDAETFSTNGLKLEILPSYKSDCRSVLSAIYQMDKSSLADELRYQSTHDGL